MNAFHASREASREIHVYHASSWGGWVALLRSLGGLRKVPCIIMKQSIYHGCVWIVCLYILYCISTEKNDPFIITGLADCAC